MDDLCAVRPAVLLDVARREEDEIGVDVDEGDPFGAFGMEKREADGADTRADVDRVTDTLRAAGEVGEQEGVDVDAVARLLRGLMEGEAQTLYFCHGRRPRRRSAVTAPGNVRTTVVPSRMV